MAWTVLMSRSNLSESDLPPPGTSGLGVALDWVNPLHAWGVGRLAEHRQPRSEGGRRGRARWQPSLVENVPVPHSPLDQLGPAPLARERFDLGTLGGSPSPRFRELKLDRLIVTQPRLALGR